LRGQEEGIYAVALPTNFITEKNSESRNSLVIIFSLGIAAVFGVGYFISRRIVQPILQLVNTSQAIAQGDLSQRTGLKRDDEIGILANTFDSMTIELQKKTVELEEEASKLIAILTSIADGVMVQDLAGNVISMNPAAQQILENVGGDSAYLHQNRLGRSPILKDTKKRLYDELAHLKFHETQRFEVGRHVLSAIAAPVVTSGGEQLGSVIVLRDISREVESERLKDDFITSVSHELRTPLTAIKGYNDLLAMTGAKKLDKKQLDFIKNIDKNVGDLLNLIQEVLDISQIEAGTLGTDQQTIDLTRLIKNACDNWVKKMAEKNLFFRLNLLNQPVWVEGDLSRLNRVIHNLIDNAYNYTIEGGIEIWLTSKNGQAEVQIIDTGVGIAQEDQRFLFTRFFRAIREEHGQEVHEISGAGLGLYMSQAIVEAHDGKMWVESELHKGSKFSFTIPLITSRPNLIDGETLDEYIDTRSIEKSEL
jgi:signal transduction histidine kinase